MNKKKRKIRVLFLAFVFLFLAQPAFAENKPIFKYGKQYELCQEIYEILHLPENKDYMKRPSPKGYSYPFIKPSPFYVPDSYKNFRYVKWEEATEEDFKEALPRTYGRLINFIEHEKQDPKSDITFKGVKKTEIDVYHRGTTDVIYKVDAGDYIRSYMTDDESDPSFLSRFFNDNGSHSIPFYYKGRIFMARGRLRIDEFRKRQAGRKLMATVCKFEWGKKF